MILIKDRHMPDILISSNQSRIPGKYDTYKGSTQPHLDGLYDYEHSGNMILIKDRHLFRRKA